jgi:hypothetical protein
MAHGIDLRAINAAKIKSGIKGPYRKPSRLSYKILYEKFKANGKLRMAARASALMNQL